MNALGLDLDTEMRSRDVGQSELAKAAGVSRWAIARMRAGGAGRPAARRALRAALAEYPVIEPVQERRPSTNERAVHAQRDLVGGGGTDPRVALEHLKRRQHLARLRENAP